MSRMTAFQPKSRKQKPKRDREFRDGRISLASKSELRMQVAERADYRCEADLNGRPCGRFAPLEGRVGERGELAHKSHGEGFRSDTEEECLWKCHRCHQEIEHGTPKYRRRPGKQMSVNNAKVYWEGRTCFCDSDKPENTSFCSECSPKLNPQTAYILQNTNDQEAYKEALAEAENDILRWNIVHAKEKTNG
jgi:hypothetical protein